MMTKDEIEHLEFELLLEAVVTRYGYDFRHYAQASLKRRIRHFLSKTHYEKISQMIPQLLYDPAFIESLIHDVSITVTEMFRDPFVYNTIREMVVPFLKTYPLYKNLACRLCNRRRSVFTGNFAQRRGLV